jgi:hypothetical protein
MPARFETLLSISARIAVSNASGSIHASGPRVPPGCGTRLSWPIPETQIARSTEVWTSARCNRCAAGCWPERPWPVAGPIESAFSRMVSTAARVAEEALSWMTPAKLSGQSESLAQPVEHPRFHFGGGRGGLPEHALRPRWWKRASRPASTAEPHWPENRRRSADAANGLCPASRCVLESPRRSRPSPHPVSGGALAAGRRSRLAKPGRGPDARADPS